MISYEHVSAVDEATCFRRLQMFPSQPSLFQRYLSFRTGKFDDPVRVCKKILPSLSFLTMQLPDNCHFHHQSGSCLQDSEASREALTEVAVGKEAPLHCLMKVPESIDGPSASVKAQSRPPLQEDLTITVSKCRRPCPREPLRQTSKLPGPRREICDCDSSEPSEFEAQADACKCHKANGNLSARCAILRGLLYKGRFPS